MSVLTQRGPIVFSAPAAIAIRGAIPRISRSGA
jgi:hypothetical protein